MSTFNSLVKQESAIRNGEGAVAFDMSPEMELYTAVVTTSLSEKFYETASERLDRIAELVGQCHAEFVAKLAVYARQQMNLRSVPLLLVVELAKVHSGDNLVSRTIDRVVLRADEIMELLHCYQWRNGRVAATGSTGKPAKRLGRLSHQIQVGLQNAFNRFNEYQFAKYDRNNLDVKLRDALFLVHPKAKDQAQQALFDKIASRTLQVPYTWETELSALGQQTFESIDDKFLAFSLKWEDLIESGAVGYMALLRNLSNILAYRVRRNMLEKVNSRIGDKSEVLNAHLFPFRFLAAYRELEYNYHYFARQFRESLEQAVLLSAQNIPGFDKDTRVVLASDVSGSMNVPISEHSSIRCYDIGLMLSMLLKNRCENVISGIFGDEWKVIDTPSDEILCNTLKMARHSDEVGFSTNGYKVIEYLCKQNIVADKVLMFTDCQMWDSQEDGKDLRKSWMKYKKLAPDAKLYLFDLSGYGNTPLNIVREDVFLIAGWSDKIFDMLQALENGSSIVEEIQKTVL